MEPVRGVPVTQTVLNLPIFFCIEKFWPNLVLKQTVYGIYAVDIVYFNIDTGWFDPNKIEGPQPKRSLIAVTDKDIHYGTISNSVL